ncbi:exodeoxyribonuclease V subunit alpha [Marinobacter nauticus]|uniref:exodeoxyribonuclease V subunit alpha n=1 Tax=Marinobacter nauticus TaxID=2743 RepID=UPI000EB03239|nr:exodeoxyribonuclease V subunit alpha [Marinobacter nauticus]MBW3197674.1 exodeoxyribonuclease V subunit alpha [Marinobacter nauticus]MBY6183084.1 exodeoxyribonuclease V subunit alpha [Marinobacter nauticus]RKR72160.1 DNA helicase/exodeoxyribonuclease V alpha subunit [Marinobacter nauticus]
MSRTRHTENQFALDLGDDTPVNRAATESPEAVDNSLLLAHPDDTEALLGQWQQAGWIRPLDTGFARLIRELSEEQGEGPQPLVLLLAALTSHQVGRGHVCIDLATLLDDAGQTLALPPEEPANTGLSESEVANLQGRYPQELLSRVQLTDCLTALQGSLAVSDGSVPAPLVLNGTRLYLRRFWRYEQRIAEGIQQRLALPSPLADPQSAASQTLSTTLSKLFRSTESVDYQKLACALAARNRFAVITGGPGTGKTTTVVNLLAALQAVAGESPERAGRKYRIRLAAPTGKAAARLNESIGGAVSKLPLADLPGSVKLEDIPTKVTTLHRLLGSRPDTRQFRHHRDNPLLVDILVIDEASMVDVDLMASVFDALPASAQLILLGDKDQLASVDAGAVLGELCQRALDAHYTPDTARWLAAITSAQVPDSLVDNSGQPLDQAVAMLRKSYRFGQDSGIRQLAESVNSSELTSQVLGQIRDAGFDDVIWLNGQTPKPDPDQTLELICHHAITGSPEAFRNSGQGRVVNGQALPTPVGYRHYLEVIHSCDLTAGSPREAWDAHAAEVLEAFNDFQVLCALRKGPWGVEGLNQRIAQKLLAEKLIDKTDGWYAGRPVLVTGNDYNLGLMNGDIGLTFSVPWDKTETGEPKTTLRVAFPSGDSTGGIRWISPSRLQQLETVYAMTVHKSQGSEFNHTCLVLPDRLSPVLTKELVYTGITRAKNWFSLITGDAQVFKDSVSQQVVRASGLALRLGEQ